MAPIYVCPNCGSGEKVRGREMSPKKNGVYVIEMADFGPYKVWMADLWECPRCAYQVIAGFPPVTLAEHYEDSFAKHLETAKASDHIYYC